jgi:hypothetical protein
MDNRRIRPFVPRYWHETQRIQQFSIFTFREQGETMNVQTHPDLTEFEFALFAAILSAHQNRERIVGCARAGGRVECPQAVGRVLAGLLVPDRRCAEDWERLRARPCQMRRAVLFPNPFCTPGSNMESKPNCHIAHSRIPRSMIDVDENLFGHSPSDAPRDIVCDASTVRPVLLVSVRPYVPEANTVLAQKFVTI